MPNFVFPCLRISDKLSSSTISPPFDSDFFFDFFLPVVDGTGTLLSKLEVNAETSVCSVDVTVGSAFASRNDPGTVGYGPAIYTQPNESSHGFASSRV